MRTNSPPRQRVPATIDNALRGRYRAHPVNMSGEFRLDAPFSPAGDQPAAIDRIAANVLNGVQHQVLLGVTGSGKTFTIANVIQRVCEVAGPRPTLVIAHNKTLAAQLCTEFREFFPHNSVEYFVSFYDYYQPEAYIPQTDVYIEKDASINDEIDRLRHAATQAVSERRDVIVVASVSCIYGLGSPELYQETTVDFRVRQRYDRRELLSKLISMQFTRNDMTLSRGTFRVRGDVLEVHPKDEDIITRIDFFDEEVEKITVVNPLTGEILEEKDRAVIFPATHFVASEERMERAIQQIEEELEERLRILHKGNKLLEAQRLEQRTRYDLEMLREVGYCMGIENYSRHLDGRSSGQPPFTLLDYFPRDFLLIIDESHQTIPQVHGMWAGDKARKDNLIDFGFRLPSAYDNRPLRFVEFAERINQVVYVSATPAEYELEMAMGEAEQRYSWNRPRKLGFVAEKRKRRPGPEAGASVAEEPDAPQESAVSDQRPSATQRVGLPLDKEGRSACPTVVEQIARPTGLVDPLIDVRPTRNQIDDLIHEIHTTVDRGERVLITTLTKRMAEDLTEYLLDTSIKVHYLHSDIVTLERMAILRDLRVGKYDVIVGINLLREGIDLPEVSLIAILDADKEGYLRSNTSLIQTIGRAARNVSGRVVMYADRITGSMRSAIDETNRRRQIQIEHNERHGITPQTIQKVIHDVIELKAVAEEKAEYLVRLHRKDGDDDSADREITIGELEKEMLAAADALEFERAAEIRDTIRRLQAGLKAGDKVRRPGEGGITYRKRGR